MYLLIERDFSGETYAYFETASQFREIQPQRKMLQRISGKQLDEECLLRDLPCNAYMVIPVKAKNTDIGKQRKSKKGKKAKCRKR